MGGGHAASNERGKAKFPNGMKNDPEVPPRLPGGLVAATYESNPRVLPHAANAAEQTRRVRAISWP